MKDYGKKFLFWIGVVLVSAGVSYATIKIVNNNHDKGYSYNSDSNSIANNSGFSMVSRGNGFQTEFTKAAEMTLNAVVHIKSTQAPVQTQNNQFFDLFYGNSGQLQPQPKV